MADLTKLIMHSSYPGFHQNNVYTGSLSISSAVVSGSGIVFRTLGTVTLDENPDILEILFNGTSPGDDYNDPRPNDGWFKSFNGAVLQLGTSSFGATEIIWGLFASVTGNQVTITAVGEKQYTENFTPSGAVTVRYRMIDYSALGLQ